MYALSSSSDSDSRIGRSTGNPSLTLEVLGSRLPGAQHQHHDVDALLLERTHRRDQLLQGPSRPSASAC
jgi:hypothetical protein